MFISTGMSVAVGSDPTKIAFLLVDTGNMSSSQDLHQCTTDSREEEAIR